MSLRTLTATALALLVATDALAGSVYVNGVNVDALRNQTFENVKVTIDAYGNVIIDAPSYRIEVAGQTTAPPATTPPAVATTTPPAVTTPPVTAPQPTTGSVGQGKWWLVTEDSGSQGHAIDVYVNGTLVTTARSGETQRIVDVGGYLRPGPNTVKVVSNSVNPSGGSLIIYVGPGNNQSGTVVMDAPAVQYGVGATRTGPFQREYQITVP